jgi:hypothetical protein
MSRFDDGRRLDLDFGRRGRRRNRLGLKRDGIG